MSLPSYDDVVTASTGPKLPHILRLVAARLDSTSLSSCCRISKACNDVLNPLLWSNPMKVLAEKKKPFTDADIFLSAFPVVRPEVRNLVTTLDLRTLLSATRRNQLDWAQNGWIINGQRILILHNLFSHLRFDIFDGLEGFQNSVWSMNYTARTLDECNSAAKWRDPSIVLPEPLLLSVAGCHDLDPLAVIKCPSMAHVVYLDISFTAPPVLWQEFSKIRFDALRILKLRGLRLTDTSLDHILSTMPPSIWSLDVRNNGLTDASLMTIRRRFLPTIPPDEGYKLSDNRLYEEAPIYHEHGTSESELRQFHAVIFNRPDDIDGAQAYIRTHAQIECPPGREMFDPHDMFIAPTGLTHLYLSDNHFSGYRIMELLYATNRLRVLDVGSVFENPLSASRAPYRLWQLVERTTATYLQTIVYGTKLDTLRIHHSIATMQPTIVTEDGKACSPKQLTQGEDFFQTTRGRAMFSFDPLTNYRLRVLTLTGVPTKTHGVILTSLTNFLSKLAKQEAVLKEARRRPSNRRAPPLLPGLRILRLEFMPMAPEQPTQWASVSGHRDADTFLAESAADFSFFDEQPKELQQPKVAPSLKKLEPIKEEAREKDVKDDERLLLDVVEGLKKFREMTKEKWGGKLELVFPFKRR